MQTPGHRATGSTQCGPSSEDAAHQSGACPTHKKGTHWEQMPWVPQGGCTQCVMPQPSREGRFGGPRASQGGDTICHQTPQACRPPTSLPATLAARWLPLHLFGQQTPQEAFLLHSLQSPPLALQTRVYVAQKAPGTINSPASRGCLRLRPGGFLTSTTYPAMGAAGGSGVPQTPFQPCLCLPGAVFAQARSWSSLHPRFPDHKIAKMGNVLVCNKYQFLYCYLTQTIR